MIFSSPLNWPDDVPMREDSERKYGKFSKERTMLTIAQAVKRLEQEVDRLGGYNAELSANFSRNAGRAQTIRLEVMKRENQAVCLRFNIGDQLFVMPMDGYTEAAQNIAGLAAHIEATRAIERHGVATVSQVLNNFAALPPRSGAAAIKPKRPWHDVLGILPESTLGVAEAVFRELVKLHHPDHGGDPENYREINEAIREAREEKKNAI